MEAILREGSPSYGIAKTWAAEFRPDRESGR